MIPSNGRTSGGRSALSCHALEIAVDLDAIAANYRLFERLCPGAAVAGVVKADAYGLGMEPVARRLAQIGCGTFFVAHLQEGVRLRESGTPGEVYVLNGLVPGTEPAYSAYRLKPVLTSIEQLRAWTRFRAIDAWQGGAALHIDTGMNRLGFRVEELSAVKHELRRSHARFDLVISHLACADLLEDPRNREQIECFRWARRELGEIGRASLAGTAGCFLGRSAHLDMVRPGIGLYGGSPFINRPAPFRPVVTARAPLVQIKRHRGGEFIGYGSGFRLDRDSLLGVISFGYADGLPRSASATSGADALHVVVGGHRARLIGRISMDLSIIDLSTLPEVPRLGDAVEICGPSQSLDELAAALDTIPNEVLTRLGPRAIRSYREGHNLSAAA